MSSRPFDTVQPSLDTRVAVLEERARQLDIERNKVNKTAIGAVVALVISILTGAYSLYDSLILKPLEAKANDLSELRQSIGKIANLNATVAGEQYSGNLAKAEVIGRAVNAEKYVLIYHVEAILENHPNEGDFVTYLTLAQEHLNFGNYALAKAYSDSALKISKTTVEKAESLKNIGKALFALKSEASIQKARETLNDAVSAVEENRSYLETRVTANIFAEWITLEALFGECEMAAKIRDRFAVWDTEYEDRTIATQQAKTLISTSNAGWRNNCLKELFPNSL